MAKPTTPQTVTEKLPYSPPRMVVLGNVRDLTLGGVGSQAEGGLPKGSMMSM